MPTTELSTDVALGVAIPARNARGRIARLGATADAILGNHDYPPVIEHLLAEALVLTALLGSLLKEKEGQITLQAQTEAAKDSNRQSVRIHLWRKPLASSHL